MYFKFLEVRMSMVLSTNIIDEYISYLYDEEKSNNTITKYSRDFEHFVSYLEEKTVEFKK